MRPGPGPALGGGDTATRRRLRVLARHPRVVVFAVVAVAVVAGWIWLAAMVAGMLSGTDMATLGPGMSLFNRLNGFAELPPEVRAGLTVLCAPADAAWSLRDGAAVFAMWVAMVAAMMLPTALPVLAAHADIAAERAARGERVVTTVVVAAGYLTVWIAYAVAATAAQWALTATEALTPAGVAASLVLAGTTTIAAGLYQFSPLKLGCLDRCRNPRLVFVEAWSDSVTGTFRQGLVQGLDCFGCCWALMTVMFVVGVMNVVWIVLLGAVMAAEKLTTAAWVPRALGVVLIVWGIALVAASPAGTALLARFS